MLNAIAHIRAYSEKPGATPLGSRWKPPVNGSFSRFQLIFDCETTTDRSQALRFGAFQLRDHGRLTREGLFYDPLTLAPEEVTLLTAYAAECGLVCYTIEEFRFKAIYKVGYKARAAIIGFNLPFDVSRVAEGWSEAKTSSWTKTLEDGTETRERNTKMQGGFTFSLSPYPNVPNIRVKHLSARAALMDFATPAEQPNPRGERKRKIRTPAYRGVFIDVKTLAAAMTSRKHSLASLCEALGVQTQKRHTEEHGGPLTREYIEYARTDVQATWECFSALKQQFEGDRLDADIQNVFSEASVGKATLSQMRVKPLLKCVPDISRKQFGTIMSTYFGGRAEVRIRKQVTEVILTDFKSMYPTVNALMGLWLYLIADGYSTSDTTEATQRFLNEVTLADMQQPETWRHLHTLVRLKPQNDVLPLRTRYSAGQDNMTIGLNHVSSEYPLWYTLADVIASKLLTGKTPQIDQALSYKPGPMQEGLRPLNLFGRQDCRIDPRTDDPFVKLINLRDEAKRRKDPIELALKILANSTCYGILVEVQRDDEPKPRALSVYGPDGLTFESKTKAVEEPGKYFHPLLATLITGAARLMLAITERLAEDRGLGWVFCDTDSMALARPEYMGREEFNNRVGEVVDWFGALNPYETTGSILKIESVNFSKSGLLEPLFCYSISAKRYALFNLDDDRNPIIRKASAHGLGHLMAPYAEASPSQVLPPPRVPLSALGVSLWQHDVWQAIIRAALAGHPNQVVYDFHPALQNPAAQRYGATSPALLRWMKHLNEDKNYRLAVKPFGFLVSLLARTGAFAPDISEMILTEARRGAPIKQKPYKPVAPFERDSALAAERAFDRETGEPVPIGCLKTYAEALALYHLSPEDKFENGGPWEIGLTSRRHVNVIGTQLIGKEANKVGEFGESDPVSEAVVEFS